MEIMGYKQRDASGAVLLAMLVVFVGSVFGVFSQYAGAILSFESSNPASRYAIPP